MSNNKAKPLTLGIVALLVVVLASLGIASGIGKEPEIDQAPAVTLERQLAGLDSLVNDVRADKGLKPLKLNAKLNESASLKAKDMVDRNYWAHEAPDGTMAWDLMKQVGYHYSHAGENLAKCYVSNQEIVDAWVESPTHLKNILNDFEDFGFGYAYRADGCMLVVNHFGKQ